MPRRARVIVPGVAHHVTQRGNNQQPVFQSADERSLYLKLLGSHVAADGTHVMAYCLMTNHVHLVVVPDAPLSLSHTLGHTHSEFALLANRLGGRTGHLWQGRFYSCPMDHALLECHPLCGVESSSRRSG